MERPIDVNTTGAGQKPASERALAAPSKEALRQLALFQTFLGSGTDHQHLSNVIELWDAAPKFVSVGKREANPGDCPDYLERQFEWRRQTFRLRVIPATLIRPDGSTYRRLPSAREELVEAALRRIAVRENHGFVGADGSLTILGVKFSLSMLRKELALHGHDIHFDALLESITILSRCQVEIALSDSQRKSFLHSSILSTLQGVSRSDWLASPDSLWSARFHPMVSQGLSAAAYRQFDYDAMMGYRTALARWLQRLIAAEFHNAGIMHPIKILLSSAIANSGLLNHARLRDRARAMEDALGELKSAARPPILSWERQPILEGRTVVDVQYVLNPSPVFIGLVKAANLRQANARQDSTD